MIVLKMTAATALIAVAGATAAVAAPTAAIAPDTTAPLAVTRVVNGYGPLPYGIYGHRHRYTARRSYGTGYHGRGTATGGPVGGLPSRN